MTTPPTTPDPRAVALTLEVLADGSYRLDTPLTHEGAAQVLTQIARKARNQHLRDELMRAAQTPAVRELEPAEHDDNVVPADNLADSLNLDEIRAERVHCGGVDCPGPEDHGGICAGPANWAAAHGGASVRVLDEAPAAVSTFDNDGQPVQGRTHPPIDLGDDPDGDLEGYDGRVD